MDNPTHDELDNDTDLQDLLADIENEILLIQREDDDEDPFIDEDDEDDDEDVFDRFSHSTRGEWHDEYD